MEMLRGGKTAGLRIRAMLPGSLKRQSVLLPLLDTLDRLMQGFLPLRASSKNSWRAARSVMISR